MHYLLLALLLVGCSVKPKPQVTTEAVTAPALPGVYKSENGKFLIHPSTTDLVPGEENTVTYRITTPELEPIDARQFQIDVEYDMPTMPQMGGPWKADNVAGDDQGKLAATYTIWHGSKVHLWQFTIQISKDGEKLDRLVYSHLVRVE